MDPDNPTSLWFVLPAGSMNKGFKAILHAKDTDTSMVRCPATDLLTIQAGEITTLNVKRLQFFYPPCGNATSETGDVLTCTSCPVHHSYPTVKMPDGKTWMAKNLECTVYDTESEKKGQVLTTIADHKILPSDNSPHYYDGRDRNLFDKASSGQQGVDAMSDIQISNMGLHYSWAAVVGLTKEECDAQKTTLVNRQGICPNGWHVPTWEEYDNLQKSIYNQKISTDTSTQNEMVNNSLKTTTGWYWHDGSSTQTGNGYNCYNFSIIPVGDYKAKDDNATELVDANVYCVGMYSHSWTASIVQNGKPRSFLIGYKDRMGTDNPRYKGMTVRCVKNN